MNVAIGTSIALSGILAILFIGVLYVAGPTLMDIVLRHSEKKLNARLKSMGGNKSKSSSTSSSSNSSGTFKKLKEKYGLKRAIYYFLLYNVHSVFYFSSSFVQWLASFR
eukprot:PhF_6_TR38907/c0_g2_i1/m.58203